MTWVPWVIGASVWVVAGGVAYAIFGRARSIFYAYLDREYSYPGYTPAREQYGRRDTWIDRAVCSTTAPSALLASVFVYLHNRRQYSC